MSGFDELEFLQLVQVPARVEVQGEQRERRDEPDRLLAAVSGLHSQLRGTPGVRPMFASAWARLPGEQSLRLLVGASAGPSTLTGPVDPDAPDAPLPVQFPPGARGFSLGPWGGAAQLGRFTHWVPVTIRHDHLWLPGSGDAQGGGPLRRGAFDRYAAAMPTPFAWVVVAEPLGPADTQQVLDQLAAEILPLTRTEVGQAKRVELERKQARHRELSRAHGGAWRVRVLVGGQTESAARSSAAVLVAAAELGGVPYTLEAAAEATPLERALVGDGSGGPGLVAGPDLVVALTRPPERELPGIRAVVPHTFDVNQEPPDARSAGTDGQPLRLGSILSDSLTPVAAFDVRPAALNRHAFVCGATGSGKSQSIRHLLTEATAAGIPWLVIEPAKAEYSRMARRIAPLGAEVVVIRPGAPEVPPAGFNPLEPAPGFALQTHADRLKALFLASFDSVEPFPQVMSAAIIRCYEQAGWDLVLGEPSGRVTDPAYPTLADLQRAAEEVVSEVRYGPEVAANVNGFIKVRLDSLRLGTTGRFFDGGHPLDFEELLTRNVVLEIESVGDDTDKAFLMGAVLIRLAEHLQQRAKGHADLGLLHLTVLEEAHRLLRRPEPGSVGAQAKAVELFAALLAEIRAYGEGLIVAEQIPGKVVPDVIKNTAVKVIHRLPALDDRDAVGATINLDQAQSRFAVSLTPGEGVAFVDGMDRPVLVRVPGGTAVERGEITTASVDSLIARRSPTCGADCLDSACTLRDMRIAQQVLDEHSWLVVWAELTVLAHLIGEPSPTFDSDALPPWDGSQLSRRTLDCALSHAVDAAVAGRTGVLSRGTSPAQFAAHCLSAMQLRLDGLPPARACEADGVRFYSKHHNLLPAWRALRSHGPDDPRDPATGAWETVIGRRIPGATAAEQFAVVDRWRQAAEDPCLKDRVRFGQLRPSRLEVAVGAAASDPGWPALVPEAVHARLVGRLTERASSGGA